MVAEQGDRAPTPFELFLQRRQSAVADSGNAQPAKAFANILNRHDNRHQDFQPTRAGPGDSPTRPRPLVLDSLRASYPRPSSSYPDRPNSQRNLRRSAPELIPQVVASLPSPHLPAGASHDLDSSTLPRHQQPPSATAVYGELASAAASLASAAQKLAHVPVADRGVAASYETLAQAAADLAASACMIRPLTATAAMAQHGPTGGAAGGRQAPKPAELRSGASLPRAVDPMAVAAAVASTVPASAAHAAAAAAVGSLPVRPGTGTALLRGASASGSRPRVAAPRFPGYNPMIHFVESDLPAPGGAPASRPVTSSPITHQLQESRALHSSSGTATPASAPLRSSCRSSLGRLRLASLSLTDPAAPLLHPSDLSRLPVLSLGPDGSTWRSQPPVTLGGGTAGGGERTSGVVAQAYQTASEVQIVDPLSFLHPFATTRLPEWPPPEPITGHDMHQEELDARYNKLLVALRDRLSARGPARLAAAFRDVDRDGLGLVSRQTFQEVLQGLNLGAPGLVDDKVVDLLLEGVDGAGGEPGAAAIDASGQPRPQRAVAYGDFVNALRFGSLPWRGYNRKLRHRVGANPDQPIGPSSMAGLPPYDIIFCNQSPGDGAAVKAAGARASALAGAAAAAALSGAAAAVAVGGGGAAAAGPPGDSLAAKWSDLREAFHRVDHNGDGVVEFPEFREALRRVGEQHRLQLSEQEVMQVYQEVDPQLDRGLDYEAFMALYRGSGAAPPAADYPSPSCGPRIPEFFQPKQLRCSHPSRPWPWSYGPGPGPASIRDWLHAGHGAEPPEEQGSLDDGSPSRRPERPAGEAAGGRDEGGGGVGGGGRGRAQGGSGRGGLGATRAEALRGAHAGAAAVLKRLSVTGGPGRAPVRA